MRNATGDVGAITFEEQLQRFRDEFIPAFREFANLWGVHRVVWDLRITITRVRRVLGLSAIVWPPILVFLAYGPETDWVTTPGRTDDYGSAIVDAEGQVEIASVSCGRRSS